MESCQVWQLAFALALAFRLFVLGVALLSALEQLLSKCFFLSIVLEPQFVFFGFKQMSRYFTMCFIKLVAMLMGKDLRVFLHSAVHS